MPGSPQCWGRLKAVGASFLWMVASAGSGELLFTPRIAAQYGSALLWALLVIDGFQRLPGPRNWALWIIIVLQLVVVAG